MYDEIILLWQEKNWDEGVHLLLCAVRESVQESLGFSPFELVFGHTVRGPFKLLKRNFSHKKTIPWTYLNMCLIFEGKY